MGLRGVNGGERKKEMLNGLVFANVTKTKAKNGEQHLGVFMS